MSFAALIGALIGDTLVLLLGIVIFFVLLRELNRRHQRHLLFFAIAALSVGLAFGWLFLSQILTFNGRSAMSESSLVFRMLMSIFPLAIVCGLVECYCAEKRQTLWESLAAAAALAVFWLSRVTACPDTLISGIKFCGSVMIGQSPLLAVLLAVFPLMIVMTGCHRFRCRKRPIACQPDAVLMWAGICGLLMVYALGVALMLQNAAAILVVYLPVFAFLALLLLGAAAKNNPDQSVVERPINFVRRSLAFKVSLLIIVMFWLLGLIMAVVTTTAFMRALSNKSRDAIRRDVSALADDLSAKQELLLQETVLAAARPVSAADAAAGRPDRLFTELERAYKVRGGRLTLRLTDAAGRVLFSTRSADEIGRELAGAGNVVSRALGGSAAASLERDPLLLRTVLRAAAPLVFDDGSRGVLTTATEYSSSSLFDLTSSERSAYGILPEAGQAILSAGPALKPDDVRDVERTASGGRDSLSVLPDGSIMGASRILDTDGMLRGYAYVLLTAADFSSRFMGFISLIVLMNLLALLIMTLTAVAGLRALLRPILDLRNAARAMAGEDLPQPLVYESLDEVGEMASAFNKMGAVITDRTARLRRALREQMDALIHTANGVILPLNVLRWTTDLLRFGNAGRLTKQQLELIEQMHQTNQRLYRMVQEFLEAAKLDQGKLVINRASFPIEEAIDQAAGMLAIDARNKKLELVWRHPRQPLPPVLGDRVHVIQILLNLLSNAIKYTAEHGRVVVNAVETGRIAPDSLSGRFIEVTVSDTGRGIPAEDIDRIFERFYRSPLVAAEDIEGTGLGLYIVRGLVELHGGRVWVESKSGSGSEFHFTLPAAPLPAE